MAAHKLQNYLRTHRKRAGLSQDEVAFLLGCRSGAKVSRYERFARLPTLRSAFAYEVIFRTPVSELFAGVFQKVECETTRRAKLLAQRLNRGESGEQAARKFAALNHLSPR